MIQNTELFKYSPLTVKSKHSARLCLSRVLFLFQPLPGPLRPRLTVFFCRRLTSQWLLVWGLTPVLRKHFSPTHIPLGPPPKIPREQRILLITRKQDQVCVPGMQAL